MVFTDLALWAGLVVDLPCLSVCVSVTMCHLSHVTCHMSPITCNVSNDRTGDMMTCYMWTPPPPVRTSLCTSIHIPRPKKIKLSLKKKKVFFWYQWFHLHRQRESLSPDIINVLFIRQALFFWQLSFNQKCVLNSLKKN